MTVLPSFHEAFPGACCGGRWASGTETGVCRRHGPRAAAGSSGSGGGSYSARGKPKTLVFTLASCSFHRALLRVLAMYHHQQPLSPSLYGPSAAAAAAAHRPSDPRSPTLSAGLPSSAAMYYHSPQQSQQAPVQQYYHHHTQQHQHAYLPPAQSASSYSQHVHVQPRVSSSRNSSFDLSSETAMSPQPIDDQSRYMLMRQDHHHNPQQNTYGVVPYSPVGPPDWSPISSRCARSFAVAPVRRATSGYSARHDAPPVRRSRSRLLSCSRAATPPPVCSSCLPSRRHCSMPAQPTIC